MPANFEPLNFFTHICDSAEYKMSTKDVYTSTAAKEVTHLNRTRLVWLPRTSVACVSGGLVMFFFSVDLQIKEEKRTVAQRSFSDLLCLKRQGLALVI